MRFLVPVSLLTALASATDIIGWGRHTTGGEGRYSKKYEVKSFPEFRAALANAAGGGPDAPKVIYIDGIIDGNQLPSGEAVDEAYYSKGTEYTWARYLDSFNATLKATLAASSNPEDQAYLEVLNGIEGQRQLASKNQEKQIALRIGSNTSIYGRGGRDGKGMMRIQNSYLAVNSSNNVIIRNLEVYSPIDLFPEWDPADGATGNWNSKFDTFGLVTATNIWIDHCTFSDGAYPDTAEPVVFGKRVMRHDGLIDITEGSDNVTVSFNVFKDHDKTNLVGNNDAGNLGPGDVGKLRVTFYGNHWLNSMQRSPRVRFGNVHVFNNLYQGNDAGEQKVTYFIGMGIDSAILSEHNAFEINYTNHKAPADLVVGNYKGSNFKEVGSSFNGTVGAFDFEAIAKRKYEVTRAAEVKAAAAAGREIAPWATLEYTNKGFETPYKYKLKKTKDVKRWVLKEAGFGKL